ncbi:MAG TPA: hypothetical protein VJM32_03230 [Candidatus Saccharimonadales bacterium]|nr:hypothetical protein [Candidatus Saccharimonadales bacterium]
MPGETLGRSYSEKTTIDGFPATQSARIDSAPSRIYGGEAAGYMVHGNAVLDRLPAEDGEAPEFPDGISRASVSFEVGEPNEEFLHTAAAAAAFALESLRVQAQNRHRAEEESAAQPLEALQQINERG